MQIPADRYRCHHAKANVCTPRYTDGSLSIFHGPRKLADYDKQGNLKEEKKKVAYQRSYPQPSPALLYKGSGEMAVDNSYTRIIIEECESPLLATIEGKGLQSTPSASFLKHGESGHIICYRIGQIYLLLTATKIILD